MRVYTAQNWLFTFQATCRELREHVSFMAHRFPALKIEDEQRGNYPRNPETPWLAHLPNSWLRRGRRGRRKRCAILARHFCGPHDDL